MSVIRVYYSFRSPYSRLGLHVIARAKLDVALIPFTGPPEGFAFNDPADNKLKLAYFMIDAPRMTHRLGLPLSPPEPFGVDLTAANKAAIAAQTDGAGMAFALAVSDARWGEGRDVSDPGVLEECALAAGWEAGRVHAAQNEPGVEAQLQSNRLKIEQDGVFGVPFAVMNAAKYWGHDRFQLLVEDASTST